MKQPPYLCFAGKAVSFIGIVVQIVRVRIVDFDKVPYFLRKWCYFLLYTALYKYKTDYILRKMLMETKEIGHIKTKEEIVEILNNNVLSHYSITYHGCKGLFIPTNGGTYPGIVVTRCNKDICRVYPHEIIYIAIEDRKSVLYLTDRKIETHYSMEHWKETLDEKSFAQPHYSYIVNLHYVEAVTKDFVTLRCGEKEYKVYTSMRKVGAFKRAVVEFGE